MTFENHLDSLIAKLRTLKLDPSAEIFYDLMSGAFVWTDEKIIELTAEELGCLRAVFSFRTGSIIGRPDERFRDLWNQLRIKYPAWIGFDPGRCEPNEDLLELYNRKRASSIRYINKLLKLPKP